jgi:hypothetical protein
MICEKCARDIEAIFCKNCGADVIRLGSYCYACGNKLEEKYEAREEEDSDFEKRIPCSDDLCIGVVENGVCRICGKPYTPEM